MGKVKLTIELGRPDGVYYAGEVISGQASVESDEEIKTREIHLEVYGSAMVHWSEGSGEHQRQYSNKEVYFSNTILLRKDDTDMFLLQPGRHQYSFQLALPPHLPSSFESIHGRVRYCAQLTIDRPRHIDDTLTRAFTVLSHLDLNEVPNVLAPVAVEGSKILCCCCCKTGPISASLKTERSGFVPGERIPIDAVCVNRSNRAVQETRVTLWQGITCHSRVKSSRFTQQLVTLKRPAIPAGGTDDWQGEEIPVPPCAPTGLPGCRVIDIDYFIELEVDPTGPSLDMDIVLPIVIGTIPPTQTLENNGIENPSGSSSHPDYLSLPSLSHQPFTALGTVASVIPENEGGDFSPSYPTYTCNSSTTPLHK